MATLFQTGEHVKSITSCRWCSLQSTQDSDGTRKNCWGARAVKVPTVRGFQESLPTMPIVFSPKKSKQKGPGIYEVPTMHGNLGADVGASKNFWGLQPPPAPSLTQDEIVLMITF